MSVCELGLPLNLGTKGEFLRSTIVAIDALFTKKDQTTEFVFASTIKQFIGNPIAILHQPIGAFDILVTYNLLCINVAYFSHRSSSTWSARSTSAPPTTHREPVGSVAISLHETLSGVAIGRAVRRRYQPRCSRYVKRRSLTRVSLG